MPLKKSSVKLSSKESKKSKPMSPVNKRASDQQFQAAQQEILLKQEHEIEKRQQQLLKEFKQRQQRQTLEIRQDALNKKQAYLNQLFDEVVLKTKRMFSVRISRIHESTIRFT